MFNKNSPENPSFDLIFIGDGVYKWSAFPTTSNGNLSAPVEVPHVMNLNRPFHIFLPKVLIRMRTQKPCASTASEITHFYPRCRLALDEDQILEFLTQISSKDIPPLTKC